MDREAYLRHWGAENLMRWTDDEVRGAALSAQSKAFPVATGLPIKDNSQWGFEAVKGLPLIPARPVTRCLGLSFGRPVFLDEGRGGCVVLEIDKTKDAYFNASVEQFAASLTEYRTFVDEAPWDTPQAHAALAAFGSKLKAIDPTPFGDPDSCWSWVIEDIGYQMPDFFESGLQ
jgi:hypothetical protein